MATIKEVAARAGVSAGTVSNVLRGSKTVNQRLLQRVQNAIRDLNYEPNHIARSLKSKQTFTLGMIIPDITNPFFPELTRGAEDAALKKNYILVTVNTDNQLDREKRALGVLKARQMDGLLLVMAPNGGNAGHIKDCMASGVPVVCLDRSDPDLKASSVAVDFIAGSEMCVRHLVATGHRRIATITGNLQVQTAVDRLQGYRNVLKEAKIAFDLGLVLEGDFRLESGYRLMKQLWLTGKRPTALFVCNGLMGLGVFKALGEMRVECPRDLAVAIFDDLPLAESFSPPITAIAQPAYEIGYLGAEMLVRLIEEPGQNRTPEHIRLPAELRIRASTALYGQSFPAVPPATRRSKQRS